jgi:hypothetical protein
LLERCTNCVVSEQRLLGLPATFRANSEVSPASVAVAEIRVPDATAGSAAVNDPDALGVAVPSAPRCAPVRGAQLLVMNAEGSQPRQGDTVPPKPAIGLQPDWS